MAVEWVPPEPVESESDDGMHIVQLDHPDYLAAGKTPEEARLNFWKGLALTFWERWKAGLPLDCEPHQSPPKSEAPASKEHLYRLADVGGGALRMESVANPAWHSTYDGEWVRADHHAAEVARLNALMQADAATIVKQGEEIHRLRAQLRHDRTG